MWERWDSYVVGRGFRGQGCNSFNHYAFGSVAEWTFAYVLGIRFENGGIRIGKFDMFSFRSNSI